MTWRDWAILSPLLIGGWVLFVRITVEAVFMGVRAERKRQELRDFERRTLVNHTGGAQT